MAIIVFSKTYASSKWCLHQFVKIIGCFKAKELVVFPVFYNVDASEIRNQTGLGGWLYMKLPVLQGGDENDEYSFLFSWFFY
ncbi:disease resistance protein (TIR-NBS-LRR class) [Medicago truncatula]|uniref:Disease resistance protein (TIR-NBS-LRR class) n=1 Tax=Medicago truncatula TaxID=3880 RepID=A0A072TW75_MEDTR|nr:disease resistance protein (TIR-NBS-LRR class) [Medicago truncatula]